MPRAAGRSSPGRGSLAPGRAATSSGSSARSWSASGMAALILARDRRLGCRRGRVDHAEAPRLAVAGHRQAAARAGAAVRRRPRWPGHPRRRRWCLRHRPTHRIVRRRRRLPGPPGRPRRRSARVAIRTSSPARAGRREPCVRGGRQLDDGSRRPSSRRSGRVMVTPSDACGTAGSVAREPRLDRRRQQVGGGLGEPALEIGGDLGAVERQAALGDDRPAVEASVHEHQADARLAIALQDGGRDRAGAAMSGQQRRMQVERARRPAGPGSPAAPAGRSRRARAGRAPAGRRRRWAPGIAGVRASGSAGPTSRPVAAPGSRSRARPRPTGRAGALTTVMTSTEGAASRASRMGTAKAPLPKKTARRRSVTRAVSPAPRPRRRRPAETGRPR